MRFDINTLQKKISSIDPPRHKGIFIADIQLIERELVLTIPFETSFGRETKELRLYPVITFVDTTGSKFVGVGESTTENMAWYNGEYRDSVRLVLENQIIPSLLKQNKTPIHDANDFTNLYSWVVGHYLAKTGLEGAYWDAVGKMLEKPVWMLFGGTRKEVESGSSIGLESNVEDIIKKVEKSISVGARRIKLKIKPGQDVEVVKSVRKAYPEIPLMVDANAAYDIFSDKHRLILKKLGSYNLMMIEQPGPNSDIYFHHKLSTEIQTPICLDESIHSLEDTLTAIDLWSSNSLIEKLVINIKPQRVGGYWESVLIAKACGEVGLNTWCGGMLESALGKHANIHFSTLQEVTIPGDHMSQAPYYIKDVAPVPELQDGVTKVTDIPGWGVVPDFDHI